MYPCGMRHFRHNARNKPPNIVDHGTRANKLQQWEKEGPDKLGLLQGELLLGNAYKMARRVGPTNLHYVRALSYARELGLDRYVREITREMKEAF